MKGFVVGLIILGGVCLVGGAAVVAYGLHKGNINDNFVTNEYNFEEDFDNIQIDVSTADVEFKKADDEKTKIVCVEKEKVYHVATVKNNVLTIAQKDERAWYQKYLFNWNWRSMKVMVFLPKTAYGDISVDADTGNIAIDKDFTFANMDLSSDTGAVKVNNKVDGKIEISVHTGDVFLTDVNAGSLKVKSSTGDIRYKNGEVTSYIDLESSTGGMDLENVKADSFKAKASTGHVHLTDTIVAKNIEIKTSTGAVRFDKSDAKDIKVETSTGSVKGTLLTPKIFDARSDTGKEKYPSATEMIGAEGSCYVRTDTGAIDLSIAQ